MGSNHDLNSVLPLKLVHSVIEIKLLAKADHCTKCCVYIER